MTLASFFRRKDTNMTEGGITWHLVSFAVPLMIGSLFQQLYNTVDSVVVGNFVQGGAGRRGQRRPRHQHPDRLLSRDSRRAPA
jgi:hypothetical protein